jgi:tetratricopeptide (TPR) repeat protein
MNEFDSLVFSEGGGSSRRIGEHKLLLLRGIFVALVVLLVVSVVQVVRGDQSSDSMVSVDSEVPGVEVEPLLAEGIRLIDQSNYVEGIAVLEAALRVDASNPLVHYNIGVAHQFNGDLEKAVAAYSEALSLDNRLEDAYYNRGLARRDLGDLEGARDDLRIAAALNPDNAAAHFNLGQLLILLGETDAGNASIELAVSLEPELGD